MTNPTDKQSPVPTSTKVEELYELIHDIDLCMMTTRGDDGALVSRPMSTQHHKNLDESRDLWFMTRTDTHKIDEIERNPDLNLGYSRNGEWVSVSGTARVVTDRQTIRDLYDPSWKAWLEDNGGNEDGGPDDPRIALIVVHVDRAVYFKRTTSTPVMYFKIAKAMITGDAPKLGEQRDVDAAAIAGQRPGPSVPSSTTRH